MNSLVIGRNRTAVEQLKVFCHSVVLAFDDSFANQRNFPEFSNYSIVYSSTDISSLKGVIPRVKEIIKWQKQFDIDIIYTNTKWDMLAAKIASFFIKKYVILISTSHNSYAWQHNSSVRMMSWLINATTHLYLPLASFVYDKLCANGIRKEKLLLLPNIIETHSWEYKTSYKSNRIFRVAYVAYVYPAKRQDFILDVLNVLGREYPIVVDCYGDVDGYPEYVSTLQEKISSLGLEDRFHLLGRVDNSFLRTKLKDYDAYFCPSNLEMSPVNLIEAQAAGLPILSANVGGVPDIIKDGETGLLYESGNIQHAVDKLIELYSDEELRVHLGTSAHKYVTKSYTIGLSGLQLKNKVELIMCR